MGVARVDIERWEVHAKSGEVGVGSSPARALADLRERLPEIWVDITGGNVYSESTPLVTNSRANRKGSKMAVETVKRVTSDLTGKPIDKPADVVKVSLTFMESRKRFELDASADDVVNLIEKANEVQVRGRKPKANGNGK